MDSFRSTPEGRYQQVIQQPEGQQHPEVIQQKERGDPKKDWLLWILADSALPTGGFIFSSGLESAIQTKHINSEQDLLLFLNASARSFSQTVLPYYREAYQIRHSFYTAGIIAEKKEQNLMRQVEKLVGLDAHFDTLNSSNHVVKRASRAQGASLLGLMSKGFQDVIECLMVQEFKKRQRVNWLLGLIVSDLFDHDLILLIPLYQKNRRKKLMVIRQLYLDYWSLR